MGILLCLTLLHSIQYIVVLTLVSSLRASSFYSALIDNPPRPPPCSNKRQKSWGQEAGNQTGITPTIQDGLEEERPPFLLASRPTGSKSHRGPLRGSGLSS